ncbi:NUDIX domain-containing protein [Rhodovastum atsumiense]|uniref:NUDIX domain-containing protein n=1 Tax=Rhodovastum atsumiense TaxID=504468 RepID=A0A5M6IWT9_9PROT|nr:NUDIX domain-containing protein [Rhodovastum atsumiense]KAA5612429.1 NUDIX domain-containing protein [Rhodovastum atsumiense]CAH2600336.1 NUDIX domain-containing protein [Rhodovastum atsumiense]
MDTVNLGWRIFYRFGFRLARLAWWVWRPAHAGALVALWHEGRLLAVRLSYRPGLNLPGGGVHRGEDPCAAACRELEEELGLVLPAEALVLAYEKRAPWDFRKEHVRVFEARLAAVPPLRPDRREVTAAGFFHPAQVLAEATSPFVRGYVAQALARRERPDGDPLPHHAAVASGAAASP